MSKIQKAQVVPIFKIDEAKRLVYGKALVPDIEDTQEDIVSKEDVELAAHGFMINMQKQIYDKPSEIGLQHMTFGVDVYVVESYIDKEDSSWILVTKVESDDIWDKVQKGEITGYSIGGKGKRTPIEA